MKAFILDLAEKVLDLYNQADANFADRSVKLEMTMEDLEKAKVYMANAGPSRQDTTY